MCTGERSEFGKLSKAHYCFLLKTIVKFSTKGLKFVEKKLPFLERLQ
jgi:hypothetical protein